MTKKISKTKKCVFNLKNYSITNILLFILIIFVVILIIFSIINLNKSNQINNLNKNINNNSCAIDDLDCTGDVIDTNQNISIMDNNVVYVADFNAYLEQFGLQESVLLNKIEITEDNMQDVTSKYNFVFNESLISSNGFEMTSLNDIIYEFKDYVMVYDPINENFKSIWLVQNISN